MGEDMAFVQTEYTTLIRRRMEELEDTFERLMRATLRENDMTTLARVERAKKSIAEKGVALKTLLEESVDVPADDWPRAQEDIDYAWTEYSEAVDRLRLEMERSSEL